MRGLRLGLGLGLGQVLGFALGFGFEFGFGLACALRPREGSCCCASKPYLHAHARGAPASQPVSSRRRRASPPSPRHSSLHAPLSAPPTSQPSARLAAAAYSTLT